MTTKKGPQFKRVPSTSRPSTFTPSQIPVVPAEPQADDGPYEHNGLRTYFFFLGFALVTYLTYAFVDGDRWPARAFDTGIYLFVSAIAVLLYAVVDRRVGPVFRLVFASLIAVTVFIALFVGDPLAYLVSFYFFFLLPIWVVVVVFGTGQKRLSPLQFFGASLLGMALWRPIYGTLPDLSKIFTAGGTLEAYSVETLWRIVGLKYLHEIVFVIVGLLLLTRTFPFVQKRPNWPKDIQRGFGLAGSWVRQKLWIDAGLGAFAFIISLFGSLFLAALLAWLFARTSIPTGADDTNVFDNMDPILTLLLSFAAGAGEELVYRGLLQTGLQRWLRRIDPREGFTLPVAIFGQALVFGIVHGGYNNLSHVLIPLAFGLWMGVVFRFGGIIACIWAHTVIDIYAFGFSTFDTHPWMYTLLSVFLLMNLVYGLGTVAYLIVKRLHRPRPPPALEPPRPSYARAAKP